MNVLKKVLIGILTLVTFSTAFIGTTVYRASQSFDYPRATVHEIKSDFSSGSGVMVAKGLMLTAFHVVGPEGTGMKVNGKPVKVILYDRDLDVALIEVEASCPCVPLSTTIPNEDEYALAVGFPLGLGKVATEGRFQHMTDKLKLLITTPIAFGNSGGGVFRWNGYHWELAGITVQVAGAPLGFGFGVPVWNLAGAVPSATIIKWIHEKLPR